MFLKLESISMQAGQKSLLGLLFVEDPGAANFVRTLPEMIARRGVCMQIEAEAHARGYFLGLGDSPEVRDNTRFSASRLVSRLLPDFIVVGTSENPDSFSFKLTLAAREAGVVSFGVVDSCANSEHRFRGQSTDPLMYAPDALIVPDRMTSKTFADLGFDVRNIVECGHPRIDEIVGFRRDWSDAVRQSQRLRWFGFDSAIRKTIVFVSELSTGLGEEQYCRSINYSLVGDPKSVRRTDIVLDEFLAACACLRNKPFLVLRLHPKQSPSDLGRYLSRFDLVSQSEPGLEVVNAADLVVGMTSVLLVEAAALGRPVLSIVPRIEERLWLGDLGRMIPCVNVRSELDRFMLLGDSALGWAGGYFPKIQGNSMDTITEFIFEFLGRGA